MMRRALLAILPIAITLPTSGHAMSIISGDGDEGCRVPPFISGQSANCAPQTISVASFWQPNNPNGDGAAWISFADTGVLGSTLAVSATKTSPRSSPLSSRVWLG